MKAASAANPITHLLDFMLEPILYAIKTSFDFIESSFDKGFRGKLIGLKVSNHLHLCLRLLPRESRRL